MFKPYPVCAFNQTPVTAALALRLEIAGRPVTRVTVTMNPFECGYAGMDSKGPFQSISATVMSIPFCIATALLRGLPTLAMMTTYDDEAVNRLVARTDLVPEPAVPTLCCDIAVELADGTRLTRSEIKTTHDFAFGWNEVSALVRGIGAESGIPGSVYDRLEAFVRRLPSGDIREIVACFGECNIPNSLPVDRRVI